MLTRKKILDREWQIANATERSTRDDRGIHELNESMAAMSAEETAKYGEGDSRLKRAAGPTAMAKRYEKTASRAV
jgi:hypothetical protein